MRRGCTIHPYVTPARAAWLERLDRESIVHRRSPGRVGYDCHQLGWTQWVVGQVDGRVFGEALTEHGREVLRMRVDLR